MQPYDPRAFYLLTVIKNRPGSSVKFLHTDFHIINDRTGISLPAAIEDFRQRGWIEYVPAGLVPGAKLTTLGEDVYLDAAGIHEQHWTEHRHEIPALSAFAAWQLEYDPRGTVKPAERERWRAANSPLVPNLYGFIKYGLVNYFGRTALGDEVLREWHEQHPEGHVIPGEPAAEDPRP